METLRMKIDIGDRSFDAEGPAEIVQRQVNAFMKLTLGGSADTIEAEAAEAAAARSRAAAEARQAETAAAARQGAGPVLDLNRILRIGRNVVWLTTKTKKASEALLILLLGHSRLRGVDLVGGSELVQGMRASAHRVLRVDYLAHTHMRRKLLVSEGKRRMRKYQLTPAGAAKAEEIARRLIAMTPPRKQSGTFGKSAQNVEKIACHGVVGPRMPCARPSGCGRVR